MKTCQAPDNREIVPAFVPPIDACDAHCHIFGPHDTFPYSDTASYWPPDAPEASLRKIHDRLGFTRAVLVQASCHGTDNRAMVDAIQNNPDRYRGVCIANENTDFEYLNNNGVKGVRFNFVKHLKSKPNLPLIKKICDIVEPMGWHLVIHIEDDDILIHKEFFETLTIPVVIDHMGRPKIEKGIDDEAFQTILEFVRKPNWWIKVSGSERLGDKLTDMIPFAKEIINATPRVLWGTDYPHPNIKGTMPNDADLLDLLPLMATDQQIHQILVRNPEVLYAF